jgi:CheY-like chemotaxis protein
VDDDHLVADTLKMVFAVHGFQSEACYSASEALGRARSFAPALMLCDVAMPGGNGLELAASMEREMPQVHVIMLTAFLSNDAYVQLERMRRRRPLTVLNKPCPPEVLLREVEQLLAPAP